MRKHAIALTLLLGAATMASGAAPVGTMDRVKPVVSFQAEPFPLADVRLLDGPFKHAMELDRRYLLSLDPDRLLHNFRVNAGLPSSARPLGGWEAPDCELRGHFVGHYLSACALMFASTGDTKLKQNANYLVAELAKCQQKLGGGYLSAFPETFLVRVETLQRVWAPWYTLHKILAGLLDMVVYCDNKQALEVAEKMAGWAKRRTDRLSDDQMQRMLGNEHGGMNEVLANLYALTGSRDTLALAQRFNHRAVLDPLSQRTDRLTGLHANTQIPKIIGAARQYELTGDGRMRTIATFFWDVVTQERSYVIGGDSDGEHFSPKERLSQFLSPTTTETCNTYNMLKLTRHLFEWDPKAEYADYYERALYNHILASQNPETGMMCYYVPLHSGSHKTYSSPDDSFWCCTGTGVENHAKYGDSIYFHDGGNGLYVNLFLASELRWKAKGLTLRQETRFPEESATRLTLTCTKPTRLSLKVRHPFWAASGFHIIVNGKEEATDSAPGSYAVLSRTWKSGDIVEVAMPLSLRTESFRDNPRKIAFLDGPIVLSAAVASARDVPVLVTAEDRVLSGVTPVSDTPMTFTGAASVFRAVGTPDAREVTLAPFYKMVDRNYAVYWDVFTADQWQAKQAEVRAELERQREMEARRVDAVHPGEEQSERDHGFAGERTYAGDFGDRKWRDARDGGWFSYTFQVLPGAPQELNCTYWGSDVGRAFDILMDGVTIATQRLNNSRPNTLFDVTYPIPPELIRDKARITVRFQAPARGMAGGVFGCQVLKSEGLKAGLQRGEEGGSVRRLDPPEQGFFARELDYEGIPIKASAVVADEALFAARERLALLLKNLPDVRYNLKAAGAELHIIGRDQVTSDLPEHRHLRGKPFDGSLTVDQRTRGLGGLLTSCGEENLLHLPGDRYAGRDICVHEFAHNIQDHGLSDDVRQKIQEQYHRSLDKGLWRGAYAATNRSEFFAELTMWYFGTHGDLHMTGPKPANGPEGLQAYDPEAYALLDALYAGRIPVARVKSSD
jgi:DUF1680 family protein